MDACQSFFEKSTKHWFTQKLSIINVCMISPGNHLCFYVGKHGSGEPCVFPWSMFCKINNKFAHQALLSVINIKYASCEFVSSVPPVCHSPAGEDQTWSMQVRGHRHFELQRNAPWHSGVCQLKILTQCKCKLPLEGAIAWNNKKKLSPSIWVNFCLKQPWSSS